MADFHRKGLAFGNQDGAILAQVFGHRLGFQRGGHDDHFQVGPARLLQSLGQGQGHVAQQIALVKFIEEDDAMTSRNSGSSCSQRSRMPSVTKQMRVPRLVRSSKRI